MKNLIFAVMVIAVITLLTSCETSNDPGYAGPPPCSTCGSSGGGAVTVDVGGGSGTTGGGINGGAGETLYGYVYDLNVTSNVTVYPIDGGQPYTVPVSTSLRNDMAQYSNICVLPCEKRYWVNVIWVQNGLTGQWSQRADTGSPDPNC